MKDIDETKLIDVDNDEDDEEEIPAHIPDDNEEDEDDEIEIHHNVQSAEVTAVQGEYAANQIQVLEGLEAVRM